MKSLCYGYYMFVFVLVKHTCYLYVVMLVVKKIVTSVDRLVVLLSSFRSPQYEAKVVYMSRVLVWYLKYVVVVCTHFAHVVSVICRFVTRPGWGH